MSTNSRLSQFLLVEGTRCVCDVIRCTGVYRLPVSATVLCQVCPFGNMNDERPVNGRSRRSRVHYPTRVKHQMQTRGARDTITYRSATIIIVHYVLRIRPLTQIVTLSFEPTADRQHHTLPCPICETRGLLYHTMRFGYSRRSKSKRTAQTERSQQERSQQEHKQRDEDAPDQRQPSTNGNSERGRRMPITSSANGTPSRPSNQHRNT